MQTGMDTPGRQDAYAKTAEGVGAVAAVDRSRSFQKALDDCCAPYALSFSKLLCSKTVAGQQNHVVCFFVSAPYQLGMVRPPLVKPRPGLGVALRCPGGV